MLGTTIGEAGINSRDIQLSAFRNVTQYANSTAVVHLYANNTVYRQYRYVLPMHVHQALCAVLDFCFFSCIASRGRKGKRRETYTKSHPTVGVAVVGLNN